MVNNAGYGIAGKFDGSNLADQLGMIDLNDRALVELTRIYWPRMLANRRGGVLNVASTASFQPGPLMAVYYASKAFVLSFSEGAVEGSRGHRRARELLLPGPTAASSASAPAPARRISRPARRCRRRMVAKARLRRLAREPASSSPARAQDPRDAVAAAATARGAEPSCTGRTKSGLSAVRCPIMWGIP